VIAILLAASILDGSDLAAAIARQLPRSVEIRRQIHGITAEK
jgi:hypothetical protein